MSYYPRMRHHLASLFLLCACGSTKTVFDASNEEDAPITMQDADLDASIKPSDVVMTQCADGQVPIDGSCQMCRGIKLAIATQQSCAISINQGFAMDGEGFITINNQQKRVFAMDRWGTGHVIAWCDSTTLPALLSAFDARGYLGQKPNAKTASFGDKYLCDPASGTIPLPNWIQYQGFDLPAKYKGNAALLAADWDVIIFCGFRTTWATDWTNEIQSFVSQHGKGFLANMDYEGVVMQSDFTNMSKITQGDGIVFDPLSLPWAPASLNASIDCVPDLPPPPN